MAFGSVYSGQSKKTPSPILGIFSTNFQLPGLLQVHYFENPEHNFTVIFNTKFQNL